MQAALVAVIAVLGTLGGALINELLQHKNAVRAESAAKAERLRQDRLEACIRFGESMSEFRSTEDTRCKARENFGSDTAEYKEAIAEAHRARVAARGALLRVELLMEDVEVIRLAKEAMDVTIEMRKSEDLNDLDARSKRSRVAAEVFITVAGQRGQLR